MPAPVLAERIGGLPNHPTRCRRMADLGHRGRIALCERELRLGGRRSLVKQLYGRVLLEFGQLRQVLRIRHR
jgi:hypothetical protein